MYYIGVDLGGTNIAAGVVNESFEIIAKGSVPTLAEREGELIVRDMAKLVGDLIEKCSLKLSDVASVGIATPGSVDLENELIVYANNLNFKDFPIVKCFKKYLPIEKVYIENDANAAALAESLVGAAKGTKSSVMVTLGTGVGGGIIINNKIYSGINYAAGELGHMVIEHNGRLCSCGRRGCWEAYSSATALVNMTKEKLAQCEALNIKTSMQEEFEKIGRVNARIAFNAQKSGDKAGCEVIKEYLDYLACGITNLINIFQPEVLSIGGGICGEGDNLLLPILSLTENEQYSRNSEKKTEIKLAKLGNDAGIIGAAGLGM
ncbi:MAG: ROK family protein [Clostridia bacterium]|jgi:glucokinase|nr:ROK family protein [Clostridia bacterium]